MNAAILALVALVPAMVGPLPGPAEIILHVALCGGGTAAIPLPRRQREAPAPCPQKACHAGCSRKRPGGAAIDAGQ